MHRVLGLVLKYIFTKDKKKIENEKIRQISFPRDYSL